MGWDSVDRSVASAIGLGHVPNHPSRVTRSDDTGGNAAGDDAASSDHSARANGHTRKDCDVAADPDVVADRDRTRSAGAVSALTRIQGMVGGVQADLGPQKHVVSDGDGGTVEHDAIEVRKDMGAEVDIASELAPECWLEVDVAAHRTHDPTQQGLAFLGGLTIGAVICIGGLDGLVRAVMNSGVRSSYIAPVAI